MGTNEVIAQRHMSRVALALGLLLMPGAFAADETPAETCGALLDDQAQSVATMVARAKALEGRVSEDAHPYGRDAFSLGALEEMYRRFGKALPGYLDLTRIPQRAQYSLAEVGPTIDQILPLIRNIEANANATPDELVAAAEAAQRIAEILERMAPADAPNSTPAPPPPKPGQSGQQGGQQGGQSGQQGGQSGQQGGQSGQQGGQAGQQGGQSGQQGGQSGQQGGQAGQRGGQQDTSASSDGSSGGGQGQKQESKDPGGWPAKRDRYDPTNEGGRESSPRKGPPEYFALYDVATPEDLLPTDIFDDVNAEFLARAPQHRPDLVLGKAVGTMRLFPRGSRNIRLPIPYRVAPKTGRVGEWEVTATANEEYDFLWLGAGAPPTTVDFPLLAVTAKRFRNLRDLIPYTVGPKIGLEAWPKDIQALVEDLKARAVTDHREIARAVAHHLRKSGHYRYHDPKNVPQNELDAIDARVKAMIASGMPIPVARAHGGVFRCDTAGWIIAILLRDHFRIPVRVVGGKTVGARVRQDQKSWAAAVVGVDDHGWNEVWIGDGWEVFDGTPEGVRPQNPEGGESNDSSGGGGSDDQEGGGGSSGQRDPGEGGSSGDRDPKEGGDAGRGGGRSRSRDGGGSGGGATGTEGQGSGGSGGGSDGESDASPGERTHGNATPQSRGSTTPTEGGTPGDEAGGAGATGQGKRANGGRGNGRGTSATGPQGDGEPILEAAEDSRELKPDLKVLEEAARGASGTGGPKGTFPLTTALFETLETRALEEALTLADNLKLLTPAIDRHHRLLDKDADAASLGTPSLNRLNQEFGLQSSYLQKSLSDTVAQIRYLAGNKDYRGAWSHLKTLELQIVRISARRDLSSKESGLLYQIRRVLEGLRQIRHPDSAAYDIADRLLKAIPGTLVQRVIHEHYGNVLELGSPALGQFYEDLKAGKLARLQRMALLRDYSEMVLNRSREYSAARERTLERSPVPRRNNSDLVIAQSIYDFDRMILNPMPGEPIFAPLFRGDQYALGTRETRRVPGTQDPVDRKLSIAYYDVSGSMVIPSPDPLEVQETLLALFVGKALSEKDPLGTPVHHIALFPVNEKVGDGRWIRTERDAMDFLREHLFGNSLPVAKDGTKLEKPFLHFYDTVAEAHRDAAKLGPRKALKKANGILFSDGGDPSMRLQVIEDARKQLPDDLELFFNFVGVGGSNPTLEALAASSNLSTHKPMFRVLSPADLVTVMTISKKVPVSQDAFATNAVSAPNGVTLDLNELGRIQPVDFVSGASPLSVGAELDKMNKDPSVRLTGEQKKDVATAHRLLVKLRADGQLSRDLRARVIANWIAIHRATTQRGLDKLSSEEWEFFHLAQEWLDK